MAKPTLLVVEDHQPLLTAIEAVMESEGYKVLTATDGVEALEMMEQTTPDLIVADIMMPRMDGYEFYEQVRSEPAWIPIPFIFLTAKAGKEDQMKGKILGAEDYITKPFDIQELLVAVEARLGRAEAIREATSVEFDELKEQIVTILSHELRTPLTYIQGYTSLALDDVPSLSPDALEEFLGAIKKGADRLTTLVEDLLLIVRLDTGQADTEFKTLAYRSEDLKGLVARTVRQYQPKASEKGVPLETDLPSAFPALRVCEPFLVDALERLLDNAIKFSSQDGGAITVSGEIEPEVVKIHVKDQGIGISQKHLDHIFERFRQIDREKMEQQGVGLGLTIAQQLIELHDGEILVKSKPGVGSTFTIALPYDSQQ